MDGEIDAAVALLRAGIDACLGLDLDALDRDGLLQLVRDVETQARRLPAVDHRLIGELDSRRVGIEVGATSTSDLLRQLLRVTSREASARVRAAADLGPRRGLTGEQLEPLFPTVAAAQTSGVVSVAHARIITATVDALPDVVEKEHGTSMQAFLLEHAEVLDPGQLARVAQRLADTLDPDGTLATERDNERRREVSLSSNRDGSGWLTGRLTPAALATWRPVLDALSAPQPGGDGEPDPRSPGQRRHDALLDAGQRLLRAGTLPDCGGVPVTILATLTTDQLRTRTGHAATAHGDLLGIDQLIGLADQADIIPVLLDADGGVLGYGRTRRLATSGQRLALAARDQGCSFPGCTRPPAWCQAHHIRDWADGGSTDLDNLTLLCGHHHRNFERLGWACRMRTGVPHWIPPVWLDPGLDPDRTPRRNTAHHTEIVFDTARTSEQLGVP